MWSLKNHEMTTENLFKSNFQKQMPSFKIFLLRIFRQRVLLWVILKILSTKTSKHLSITLNW